jgi:hypothetical protein
LPKNCQINLADLLTNTVITGFNTDINYEGITYHVQTEDKGLDSPLILSLVYNGGTILASKRSPYEDLITAGFDEKELAARLQKQHKLICAAIRAGRIEDLKRMTTKESATAKKVLAAQKEANQAAEQKIETRTEIIKPKSEIVQPAAEIPLPSVLRKKPLPPEINQPPIKEPLPKIPETLEDLVWDIPIEIIEESLLEAAQDDEEELILPAEAVAIITDTPEQAIKQELSIELLNDVIFKGGERKPVSILVRRGSAEKGLSGAHIMVKIVGSAFRPLVFHSKTDSNGIAVVHLQVPHFRAGRAAILIKAMSDGDEVEIRKAILQS